MPEDLPRGSVHVPEQQLEPRIEYMEVSVLPEGLVRTANIFGERIPVNFRFSHEKLGCAYTVSAAITTSAPNIIPWYRLPEGQRVIRQAAVRTLTGLLESITPDFERLTEFANVRMLGEPGFSFQGGAEYRVNDVRGPEKGMFKLAHAIQHSDISGLPVNLQGAIRRAWYSGDESSTAQVSGKTLPEAVTHALTLYDNASMIEALAKSRTP